MKVPRKNTHTYNVWQWLLKGKTITSMQAIDMFRCTRLAEVIHRLRNEYGMIIKSNLIKMKNHNGTLVEIAKYELISEF